MHNAKSRAALLPLALLLFLLTHSPGLASFSALFVYGDGVSATNEPVPDDPLFYGKRNCNGRVWVEVIEQWHGLAHVEARNVSRFSQTSEEVVPMTANFVVPSGVTMGTALFVIWVNNADFVDFSNADIPPYTASDLPAWTNFINQSVSRHVQMVTNLYNKGARFLLMPNAADIMAVPNYNDTATNDKAFIRDRVIEFNAAFETAMANQAASKAGLVIYRPKVFSFFEQVIANPSAYGLVNPFPNNAAAYDLPNANKQYGPGLNYVFWDYYHPTAMFQMHLAEFFQRAIAPPKVGSIAVSGGNVQMQVANIPLGRAGAIQGSATLSAPWANDFPINEPAAVGGATTKSYTFPASGPNRFYRVGFPVVWTWP